MKIILFSRAQIAHTPEEIRQLFEAIDASGFDYAVNLTYGSEYFDDGALLSDLRLLLDEETGRHVRR